jgi:uncharacterized protein (TIGR00725 family)
VRTIVGVMGGGTASAEVEADAVEMGRLIAEAGFVLLTGGRDCGVMAAASRGASEAGGLVVGVLPTEEPVGVAPHVDVAIPTGMGDARNVINVLASRIVIAMPGGAGTISEVAHALKLGRPVVTVGFPLGDQFHAYRAAGLLSEVDTPTQAIELVRGVLAE